MTFRQDLLTTVMSVGACQIASQAHAFAVTDVSIRNSASDFASASAAQQGKGKAKVSDINALTGVLSGSEWLLLDETNKCSTAFNELSFRLTADLKQTSGVWKLSSEDSYRPLYMDFVLIMKGEGQWGAYLFESRNASSGMGEADGSFQMPFINKHGKAAKLDHAAIYGRLATASADPESPSIPIPGSLALMALGLGLGLRQLKWTSKPGQSPKWRFYPVRSNGYETQKTQPPTPLQGQSGTGRSEGRQNTGRAGRTV